MIVAGTYETGLGALLPTVLGATPGRCPIDLSDTGLASYGLTPVPKVAGRYGLLGGYSVGWAKSFPSIRGHIQALAAYGTAELDRRLSAGGAQAHPYNQAALKLAKQVIACTGGPSAGAPGGFFAQYKWPIIGGAALLAIGGFFFFRK